MIDDHASGACCSTCGTPFIEGMVCRNPHCPRHACLACKTPFAEGVPVCRNLLCPNVGDVQDDLFARRMLEGSGASLPVARSLSPDAAGESVSGASQWSLELLDCDDEDRTRPDGLAAFGVARRRSIQPPSQKPFEPVARSSSLPPVARPPVQSGTYPIGEGGSSKIPVRRSGCRALQPDDENGVETPRMVPRKLRER